MKFSIYNSVIYIGGHHTLIYNSFAGKFVVIRNSKINIEDLSIEVLRKEQYSLYKQFEDANVIIEDQVDEVSLLKERIDKADNNIHEYILHINPTLDCNFRCWYCYENHISNSRMSDEVLESTLKYISSILNDKSIHTFELGFFGGEPLFYFNGIAKKIITHTQSLCSSLNKALHIHFTSNGFLLNGEIVEFLSKFSCGFQITLDGGGKVHDKIRFNKDNTGSFDTIIKNIFLLVHSKIDVIVRVNYTSENIDSIYAIYESFKKIDDSRKKYIKFDFQRVWQNRNDRFDETENKIKEIRRKFRDASFNVLANYIPHDVGNSCYGDKINHVLINYNGDVFGCTARDFTPENRIGYIDCLGGIHYDNYTVSKRNQSKLSKAICKICRIAPICGGGCKQRAFEDLDSEECTFHYSEKEIDDIITDIFEYSFIDVL